MKEQTRFPFSLWKSLRGSASGNCTAYVYAAETHDEMLLLGVKDKIEVIMERELIATLGQNRLMDETQKPNSLLDDEGFVSTVYDDVIQVDSGVFGKSLYIVCLHRSGVIRSWRYNRRGARSGTQTELAEQEKPADKEETADGEEEAAEAEMFEAVGTWLFPGAAPRFLVCHASLGALAVADADGRCYIYNFTSGANTHKFEGLFAKGVQSSCLRFHPSRALVLIAATTGDLHLLDLCRGLVAVTCTAHDSAVSDAAFVDIKVNGKLVPCFVTVAGDRRLKAWNTSVVLKRLLGKHSDVDVQLGMPPGEVEKVSGSSEKRRGGETILAKAIQSNPEGKLLNQPAAQMRTPETINSFAIVTKSMVAGVLGEHASSPTCSTWFVLAGGESGQLRLFDLATEREFAWKSTPGGPLEAKHVADEKSRKKSKKTKDKRTKQDAEADVEGRTEGRDGKQLAFTFGVPQPPVKRLIRSPRGESCVVISVDEALVFWSVPELRPIRALNGADVTSTASVCRAYPGGCKLYSCALDGNVSEVKIKWDQDEGELRELVLENEKDVVGSVDVSADGGCILVATKPGAVYVLRLECGAGRKSGLVARVRKGLVGPLVAAVLWTGPMAEKCPTSLEAGRPFALTVGSDNFVRVWPLDPQAWEEKELEACASFWKASEKPIYCVSVAAAGGRADRLVATAGADKLVHVWQVHNGAKVATLKGHRAAVTALAWHPRDSALLVSASVDGTLKLWNINSAECVRSFTGASDATCNVLAFVPIARTAPAHVDGQGDPALAPPHEYHLMGGCADGSLHCWAVDTGLHLGVTFGHQDRVTCICAAVYAGSRAVLSAAADGSVRIWKDEAEKVQQEQLARTRLERSQLAQVDSWLASGDFDAVVLAACTWRRPQLLQRLAKTIAEQAHDSHYRLEDLIRHKLQTPQDKTLLLLCAVHFSNSYATIHIAHWIASSLLATATVDELLKLDGFREFCLAFNVKTLSQLNRWERLKEKSFLLELLALGGDVPNFL